MVSYRPKERISISDIKKHPWLKELFKSLGDIDQDEKIDFGKNSNQSDKKNYLHLKKIKKKPKFYLIIQVLIKKIKIIIL